jgi:hypothetical protein
MSTLNQEAPPAPVSNSQDFVHFTPLPSEDSYVATVVAFNYIPEHTFERTDKATGAKRQEVKPAIELFFGTMVDGKPYFVKTYPQQYSINEKSNYAAWYAVTTGALPTAKQRPSDMLGKLALLDIELKAKTSRTGKNYTATKIANIGKVPKALVGTATPLDKLKLAFDAALKKSGDATGSAPVEDTGNAPL